MKRRCPHVPDSTLGQQGKPHHAAVAGRRMILNKRNQGARPSQTGPLQIHTNSECNYICKVKLFKTLALALSAQTTSMLRHNSSLLS